jgi:hypothetical protein
MSHDFDLPELPSDEELGIADMNETSPDAATNNGSAGSSGAGSGAGSRASGSRASGGSDGSGGSGGGAAGAPPATPAPGVGTPDRDRPGPAWKGPVTLLVLVLGIWMSSTARYLPTPEAANAPDSVFSSARAMTVLTEISRRPHPTGSPELDRVRDVLVGRLTELGLEPEVHTHIVSSPIRDGVATAPSRTPQETGAQAMEDSSQADGRSWVDWDADRPVTVTTVRNVLARVPGRGAGGGTSVGGSAAGGSDVGGSAGRGSASGAATSGSTGTILLLAHYDGRTVSRGAGDDGVGVVTILETLRALQSGPGVANDLLVLFTDAEELGLFGARAFVDHHLDTTDVRLVLNVEMRGGGGPSIMFETGAENGWVVEQLAGFDPHPSANSMSLEVYRRMPNDTDFSPFRDAGVQGLNFAAIGRGNVYHQAYDDPAHLSEATMQHHGSRLLASVRAFGELDLSEVNGPERAYWVLPVVGMQTLPLGSMPLAAAVLALLLVATTVTVLARGVPIRDLVIGLAAGIVILGGSAGLGAGLLRVIRGRHAEFGALHGAAVHHQAPYVIALALAVAALAISLWVLLRRRSSVAGLALGMALPPAVLAVALALIAPGAAMILLGPVAALLVAITITGLAGPKLASGPILWPLHLAAALVALAFVVPVIELVADAMTLGFAVGLGAVVALAALTVAPALEGLRAPNGWWAPGVLALAALGAAGLGLRDTAPTAMEPAPSTLTYLQDQGAPDTPVQAWWVSARDGGLAWAEQQVGQSFDGEVSNPERWGLRPGLPAVAVSAVTLEPLRLTVRSDTVIGAGRRVRIGIPTPRTPERLDVELGAGAGLVAVDGVGFRPRGAERPRQLRHYGRPASEPLTLEIEVPLTATAIDLFVREELQRPWEVLGGEWWQRPPELAPNVNTQSDRALIRSYHRVLLDGAEPAGAASVATDDPSASGGLAGAKR